MTGGVLSISMEIKGRGTRDIYEGADTKTARKTLPRELWSNARRKLDRLYHAKSLNDLRWPGGKLEALKGERKGQHSIRINDQYWICFVWTREGAKEVEMTDYH